MQEELREAMRSGTFVTINVQYRYFEGYHVFTSDDVDGLYIASKDPRKAFDDVKPAIELLVRKNEGFDCVVESAMSYRDFMAARHRTSDEPELPHPAVLSNSQFVLRAAA